MSENPEEDWVRALLAEAGGSTEEDAPPPEVTARLDDVLAELVAQRRHDLRSDDPGTEGFAPVVALAPRRRRWGPALLAAAAASVAVVGVGAVLHQTGTGNDASSAADSATAESKSGSAGDATGGSSGDGPGSVPAPVEAGGGDAAQDDSLSSRRSIAPTVRRLYARSEVPSYLAEERFARCAKPQVPARGTKYVVTYDGQDAWLVLSPARGGAVVARVYPCEGGDPLLTERVPLR